MRYASIQTNKQTDILIAILRMKPGGGVVMNADDEDDVDDADGATRLATGRWRRRVYTVKRTR